MSNEPETLQGEVVPLSEAARRLTGPQMQAAVAEAAGATRKQIGLIANVSEGTVRNWRKNEDYVQEVARLKDAQAEVVSEPVQRMREEMVDGVRKAIAVLVHVAENAESHGSPSWGARTEAARTLLQYGVELHNSDIRRAAENPAGPTQAVQVVIGPGAEPPGMVE